MAIVISAENISYRPAQCPSCMYFGEPIDSGRCRRFNKGGMPAMFEGETKNPCPEYQVADFVGTVKTVNEKLKTAVFSLSEVDIGGFPGFNVPDDAIRERLHSSIGGPPVLFSVRNGEVVEVKAVTFP